MGERRIEEHDRRKYANLPDLRPEHCPVCHEERPIEDWIGQDFDLDPTAMVACARCREKGPPPVEVKDFPALTRKERQIVKDMLTMGSVREVARKHGVGITTVQGWFEGKRRPHLRRAFQRLLEAEGLDAASMARLARHLLASTRAQWNKNQECWDFFPDNMARFQTFRHLTKLHELEPMNEKEGGGTQVAVVIETNLGGGESPSPPGHYEIEVNE